MTDAFEVFPKIEKKDNGWTPRYLVADLATAVADAPAHYVAKVVRVNPAPAPWETARARGVLRSAGAARTHEQQRLEPLVT